jgi:hypothetical protein
MVGTAHSIPMIVMSDCCKNKHSEENTLGVGQRFCL